MTNRAELLACPFCGKSDFDQWPNEWLDGSGVNVIRCAHCHGAAPIATWNRRATRGGAELLALAGRWDQRAAIYRDEAEYSSAGVVEDCAEELRAIASCLVGLPELPEPVAPVHVYDSRDGGTKWFAPCDHYYTADQLRDYASRAVAAKQAQIDALMLEYCPEEMTPEQKQEWLDCQVPARAVGVDSKQWELGRRDGWYSGVMASIKSVEDARIRHSETIPRPEPTGRVSDALKGVSASLAGLASRYPGSVTISEQAGAEEL